MFFHRNAHVAETCESMYSTYEFLFDPHYLHGLCMNARQVKIIARVVIDMHQCTMHISDVCKGHSFRIV